MKNLVKLYAVRKFLGLVLIIALTLCGCVSRTHDNGVIVEHALDQYTEQEEKIPHRKPAETYPEPAVDTPAVNADREEMQGINREAYYDSEATVTGISGNQITFSYPGGSQGNTTSVTITDPSHRYVIGRTYVVSVYDTYVKVVQINPVRNFGKCDIVSAPEDGR